MPILGAALCHGRGYRGEKLDIQGKLFRGRFQDPIDRRPTRYSLKIPIFVRKQNVAAFRSLEAQLRDL